MSKPPKDQTTAARERGPVSPPQEVGISTPMRDALDKINLNPEIKARLAEHIRRKGY
jgi:hypothetical protein